MTVTSLDPRRQYSHGELRTRALSILRDGRLQLRHVAAGGPLNDGPIVYVQAVVHGHTGRHALHFDVIDGGWRCSCPVEGLCHHIVAAEMVTHAVTPHGTADQPKDRLRRRRQTTT